MSAKAFVSLLVGVLVLGGLVGASFIGGMVLGKNSGAEAADNVVAATAPQPPSAEAQSLDEVDGQGLSQLRQRIQSGEATQEEIAELRQQLRAQFGAGDGGPGGAQGFGGGGFGGGGFGGGGFGGGGFGGRGGLIGTLEAVDGNLVTLNTAQGPLHVTVTEDTTIQKTVQVTLADLVLGEPLTVGSARGEDGAVEATTIFVLPEGQEGLRPGGFGGGGGGGGRRGGGFGGGQQ